MIPYKVAPIEYNTFMLASFPIRKTLLKQIFWHRLVLLSSSLL